MQTKEPYVCCMCSYANFFVWCLCMSSSLGSFFVYLISSLFSPHQFFSLYFSTIHTNVERKPKKTISIEFVCFIMNYNLDFSNRLYTDLLRVATHLISRIIARIKIILFSKYFVINKGNKEL